MCYFITKCDRSLLQNTSDFLLQNATVLLQNATVITNWDDFITKCDSYYKLRRLLQIATVQTLIEIIKKFLKHSSIIKILDTRNVLFSDTYCLKDIPVNKAYEVIYLIEVLKLSEFTYQVLTNCINDTI